MNTKHEAFSIQQNMFEVSQNFQNSQSKLFPFLKLIVNYKPKWVKEVIKAI